MYDIDGKRDYKNQWDEIASGLGDDEITITPPLQGIDWEIIEADAFHDVAGGIVDGLWCFRDASGDKDLCDAFALAAGARDFLYNRATFRDTIILHFGERLVFKGTTGVGDTLTIGYLARIRVGCESYA